MNQKESNNCVRNAHGIWINKGCMSCRFRIINQGKRLCGVTNKRKNSTDICDRWELSDGLKNAGLGSGKVKPSSNERSYTSIIISIFIYILNF